VLLSGIGFLQVFIHHVLYFHSMRVGWNWKNASTALVHLKLLHLYSGVLQSSGSGTGMMVNLISNDVSRFEEFAIVMQPYNMHDDE
jgi:ATP-binding cassette subfamily C (CFTR/MRP) protein 4